MDQQRYDYLTQQRRDGLLSYDDAMAYDAAESRGEFNQWKQSQAAAPPDQGQAAAAPAGPQDALSGYLPAGPPGIATVPPVGNQQPLPATPPAQTTTPNPMIPTQNNPYPQPQQHGFLNDLGIPNDTRYIGHLPELANHPGLARVRNALDFTPEGRQLGGGAPDMVRTLGEAAWMLPTAMATQATKNPQAQDLISMVGPYIQTYLLMHLMRGAMGHQGNALRQFLGRIIAGQPVPPPAAAPPAAAPPAAVPPAAPPAAAPPAVPPVAPPMAPPPQGPGYPPPGGQWWQ